MLPIRLALLLAAAVPVHAVQATQTAIGFATFEDFESYDLDREYIDFCPGETGPDNSGLDCDFGRLEGGSVSAASEFFPATSGSQVYVGINISLEGIDAFNNSWPGIQAYVTSSNAPVTLTVFSYDYDLGTEVPFFTSTIAANLTNQLMGVGTELAPVSMTRFVFSSAGTFAIDDLRLGLEGVAPGIPEPATWLMMILGFGAVGGALRQRRHNLPATRDDCAHHDPCSQGTVSGA